MTRFAKCPGEGCPAKVRIIEDPFDPAVNFCCIPCWESTWEWMLTEDNEAQPRGGHSGQCWDRQVDRIDLPVVEGQFKIHTPPVGKVPPSRLGGNGGQEVRELR